MLGIQLAACWVYIIYSGSFGGLVPKIVLPVTVTILSVSLQQQMQLVPISTQMLT